MEHSLHAFLDNIGKKFNCHIDFIPLAEKSSASSKEKNLFYKSGKIGVPFFFKEQLYGNFLIEPLDLKEEYFGFLEHLIKDGLKCFLESVSSQFYYQYLLPQKTPKENIISFFNKSTCSLPIEGSFENPAIVFVSAKNEREAFQSAFKIHQSTAHLAFLHLDHFMKKEGSFRDWELLYLTTLFVPQWNLYEKWQKKQVHDFISLTSTPLPPKLIIGLEEGSLNWKIS